MQGVPIFDEMRGTGVTVSREQAEWAQQRYAGLPVEFRLQDYRELDGSETFDRVASVGMFEHIGVSNFPVYFATAQRLLKPGGLFLNHGITNDTGWQAIASARFINEYIFPDGELARVSDVCNAMELQKFEILDVECLRPHCRGGERRSHEHRERQHRCALRHASPL